ncbi:hypothetical protein M9435_003039 [Picochlorum sp. BPE23]|nr:hypothetical protein M9435_003039 [Picochlorum sp. BPE23]
MKNVIVVSEETSHAVHVDGTLEHDTVSRRILSMCGDDRVFICHTEEESVRGVQSVVVSCVEEGSVSWEINVMDALGDGDATVSDAILRMSLSHAALCVGLSTGHIMSIDVSGVGAMVAEEVGMIEGGIAGMEWSPDGEMVVIVGGYGQCLLLTAAWDVLMEMSVWSTACSDPQPTAAPEKDALGLDESEDPQAVFRETPLRMNDVSISWRGDCRYFSTVVRVGGCDSPGRIRVWDVDDQVLHAIGEQSPGTLPVVAWQPNGRVLCVANYLSDRQVDEVGMLRQMTHAQGDQGQAPEVRHVGAWKRELKRREEAEKLRGEATGPSRVFLYERNGLQHGEFVIPGDCHVEYMEWSSDSKTLAIVLTHDSGAISVQIWCRSNWKWYNKFTRRIVGVDKVRVMWQDALGGGARLCMLTSDGQLTMIGFVWGYHTSEYGTVGVVDGRSILVTPMSECMIPPPMCAVEVGCGKPIISLDFTVAEGGNELVGALLDDGSIAYAICEDGCDWEGCLEIPELSPESDEVLGNPLVHPMLTESLVMEHSDIKHYRHFVWMGSRKCVVVGQSSSGVDSILQYGIDLETSAVAFENATELEGPVVRLIRDTGDANRVVFEFQDGSLYYYSSEGQVIPAAKNFPSCCDCISSLPSSSGVLMGLNRTGKLCLGDRVIASDVASFAIHYSSKGGPHLLYTLRSNFIRTLPLSEVEDLDRVPPVVPGDVSVRAIEDGAVIVTCPHKSVDVILHAPRGNLEIIKPRALVLPALVAALEEQQFKKAWTLATVNRLDLNILSDYKWPQILDTMSSFMESIQSDVDVAGFLQALSDTSVLGKGGLYSSVLRSSSTDEKMEKKIESVCKAVQKYIVSLDSDMDRRHWLCTELTTYTKCNNIGRALLRIKDVKESDLNIINNQGIECAPKITAESGLKHMLLHIPENDVYLAALAEYELEIAYMVITHSQRDPGEYLAQLQQFAVIENDSIKKAEIDKHLQRYDRALEHLIQAGAEFFNDALTLATSHGLLRNMLALIDKKDQRKIIHKTLGDYLSSKSKYEDAGLAYIAGEELEHALRAYRLAGAWKPAITLATRLGKDENYIIDLASRLANDLEEAHNFEEAAILMLEYLRKVPDAVRLYARAGNWREALRVAVSLGSMEMVDSVLAPVAADVAGRLLEGFKEDCERVQKYWNRLQELRERRAAMDAMKAAADEEALLELVSKDHDPDLDQEAASVITDMSIYTDASLATTAASGTSFASTIGGRKTMNKKKKKKKTKIRQGSPEEEAQLAQHILSLLPLPSVCNETGQLSEFLVFIGHEDDAAVLQRALKELIDQQSQACADILSHPPPGKSFDLPDSIREIVFNHGGRGSIHEKCPLEMGSVERSMR